VVMRFPGDLVRIPRWLCGFTVDLVDSLVVMRFPGDLVRIPRCLCGFIGDFVWNSR
jgi:hypothetical protein